MLCRAATRCHEFRRQPTDRRFMMQNAAQPPLLPRAATRSDGSYYASHAILSIHGSATLPTTTPPPRFAVQAAFAATRTTTPMFSTLRHDTPRAERHRRRSFLHVHE